MSTKKKKVTPFCTRYYRAIQRNTWKLLLLYLLVVEGYHYTKFIRMYATPGWIRNKSTFYYPARFKISLSVPLYVLWWNLVHWLVLFGPRTNSHEFTFYYTARFKISLSVRRCVLVRIFANLIHQIGTFFRSLLIWCLLVVDWCKIFDCELWPTIIVLLVVHKECLKKAIFGFWVWRRTFRLYCNKAAPFDQFACKNC